VDKLRGVTQQAQQTPTMVRSDDGTEIAVYESGVGPALVLVAGALGDHTAAGPLLPHLTNRFTVHSYDRRGRGASGDTQPHAVDREIEDLFAVVDHAGPGARIYGHSSGAMISLEAVARGLPVPAITVYEPPYIVDDQRPRPPADLPDRLQELIAAGDRDGAVRLFFLAGPRLTEQEVDGMRAAPFWPALIALAHTVSYDARVSGECVLPVARFRAIGIPVAVLLGGASPGWMRAGCESLAANLSQAKLTVLDGQTHAPDPALLARELVGAGES
jgi:hypothetical protein